MPLLLAAPFVAYVLALGSVRSRRGAAGVSVVALVVMLASTLLIGWARFKQTAPYSVAYQWINIPVAFTGDARFQGFGIDLSFSVDHVALAALVAVLVIFLACLTWHRVAGRGEQGPVRYQVNAILLALGAAGVLVSGDLGELLAFWLLAGLGTYLLLGHRWGTEGAGRRSMIALAIPFAGDVALLGAIAVVYSRFGLLTISGIPPVLLSSIGVGTKSLTVAAILFVVAAGIRSGIWPFTPWQTGTVDAPPASVALVSGVWPILSAVLLIRMLPLLGAAGPQAAVVIGIWLGVAAVVGPLLGLVGVELRRSLLLGSSGAVALGLLGVVYPASTTVALTGLLAIAGGRVAILLAGASAVATLRAVDLRVVGGGWARMPLTSAALAAGGAVVALGAVGAAMLRPAGTATVAFAAGMFVVALAVSRVYFAFAHGELRRRRAFEPARVREMAAPVTAAALVGAALGVVALALSFFTGWVGFLHAGGHAVGAMPTDALWLLSPVLGAGAGAGAFLVRRDESLGIGARLGDGFGLLWDEGGHLYERFFAVPGGHLVHGVEDVGVSAAEGGVGRALSGTSRLAGVLQRGLPLVPTVLGVVVVLAVLFGLLSQGVLR